MMKVSGWPHLFCVVSSLGIILPCFANNEVFHVVFIGQESWNNDTNGCCTIVCEQATTSVLTLNLTCVTLEEGREFVLYVEVQNVLEKEPAFVFLDHTLVSANVLDLLTEHARLTHIPIIALQVTEDTPQDLCLLTSYYRYTLDTTGTALITGGSPPPHLHGVAPLDHWTSLTRRAAQVVLDIVNHLKWKQILVVYEMEFESQVRAFTGLVTCQAFKYGLVTTENFTTMLDNILQYFERSNDLNMVVVASYQTAQDVLKATSTLEPTLGKRISVTGRSNWLIFSQDGMVDPSSYMFTSHFDNIAVICDPYNLHPTQLTHYSIGDMLTVKTLMYRTHGRELSHVGVVDSTWGLTLNSDVFPNIKFGFNGRLFLITTNMWDPYVYRRVVDGTVEYYGFCMDLASELSRTLNFTIEYTEPPDGNWGADVGNGSWNGMVGQVQRQEVDLIIAPIGVTGARERVIDFTVAFFYDDSAVILKKPDPEKNKWRTYIDIFKREVLMCLGAALFLGALVSFGVEKAGQFAKKRRHKINVFSETYLGSVWYLMGAMIAQGGRNLPTLQSSRIFVYFWWAFCLVIAGTYSGNLIAMLTVTKNKPPFNTLEEMANQEEYKFGTLGQSMWTTLFETSPRPEFQAIFRKMESFYAEDPNIYNINPNVHLKMVKAGGYAYVADKGLFSSWLAYNCDLMLLKEKFFPGEYAVGLPNNSVYTRTFSDQILKIYESGLLQVWVEKWWPERSFCEGDMVTEAKSLTLVDVQSTFYLIGIGFVLGGLVLVGETILHKFRSDVSAH